MTIQTTPRLTQKAVLLLTTGMLAFALPAQAATLVEYDFEDSTVSGTAPNRVWTIYDQAGPPYTNATASEANGQTVVDFGGGKALHLNNASVSLGNGADDELYSDFSSGLVLEATFRITGALSTTTQVLFAKSGGAEERTFSLHVNTLGAASNAGRVQFYVYPTGGGSVQILTSNIEITENETYRISTIFDPFDGKISMSITGFATDYAERATTALAMQLTDSSFYIGGRGAAGTDNRLRGYMDDVVIATIPEPSAKLAFLFGCGVLCTIRLLRGRRHGLG